MAKSSQKLVDKGWNRIQRDTAQLSRLYVDVGIQADAGTDDEGNPIIVRAVANEFGAKIKHPGGTRYVLSKGKARFVSNSFMGPVSGITKAHSIVIPERSFVRSAFDENRIKLEKLKERLYSGVIDGKLNPLRAAGLLGQQHEKDIKDKIRSITTPALSPSTIARKKSSKPLIDTGQMLNSVRYVVGKGK